MPYIDPFPNQFMHHVSPFPGGGFADYGTAIRQSIPWNGDPENTWTLFYAIIKPRIRVKAGREVVQ